MISVFVSVVSIIIYSPTSQHFISPLEPCYLSHICNHTWISECGLDEVHSHRRIFLDECDRFEYNCDYSKGYLKTEMSECEELDRKDNKTTIDPRENKTSVNVNTYSNDTTITSATEPKSTEPTKGVVDEPDPSNFTTVTEATISTTKSLETICMICTRPSENETLLCKTIICNNSTITSAATPETIFTITSAATPETISTITSAATPETIFTITSAATPETISTITSAATTETKCTKTTDEPSTTTNVATITETMTTTVSTPITEASTTINSSTTSEETTQITATTTTQAITIMNATTLTEASTTEGTTTPKIEEKVNSTISKLCSVYPKSCNRPTTWETTVEGETRDFFQILKKRFGRRAIVMKHTTHFPKQKSLYENLRRTAAFLFGNHIEKHRLS